MFPTQTDHYVPAMTNTERQRKFRARHPGYYGRLHRQRTAHLNASITARTQVPAQALLPAPTQRLLPTPVEPITLFVFPDRAAEPVLLHTTETPAASVLQKGL